MVVFVAYLCIFIKFSLGIFCQNLKRISGFIQITLSGFLRPNFCDYVRFRLEMCVDSIIFALEMFLMSHVQQKLDVPLQEKAYEAN